MKIKNMIVLGIFLSIFSVHILTLIFFERGEGSCTLQLPFPPLHVVCLCLSLKWPF